MRLVPAIISATALVLAGGAVAFLGYPAAGAVFLCGGFTVFILVLIDLSKDT